MGRGGCVISRRDLDVLETLSGKAEGYRLSELAEIFDRDPSSVHPHLRKLSGYKMIESYAERVDAGAAVYYRITPIGGTFYELFKNKGKKPRPRTERAPSISAKEEEGLKEALAETRQKNPRLYRHTAKALLSTPEGDVEATSPVIERGDR